MVGLDTMSSSKRSKCHVVACTADDEGRTFHKAPYATRKKAQWTKACGLDSDAANPPHPSVCSIHFKTTDYDDDLKTLKKEAVPSLFLPAHAPKSAAEIKSEITEEFVMEGDAVTSADPCFIEEETEEDIEANEEEMMEEALQEFVNEEVDDDGAPPTTSKTTPTKTKTPTVKMELPEDKMRVELMRTKAKLADAKAELKMANETIKKLRRQSVSALEAKGAKKEVRLLEKKLAEAKAHSKRQDQKIRAKGSVAQRKSIIDEFLKKHRYTRAQRKVLITGKTVRAFGDEDYVRAAVLRQISEKAFNYLRCTEPYPIPGFTTLRTQLNNPKVGKALKAKVAHRMAMLRDPSFTDQDLHREMDEKEENEADQELEDYEVTKGDNAELLDADDLEDLEEKAVIVATEEELKTLSQADAEGAADLASLKDYSA